MLLYVYNKERKLKPMILNLVLFGESVSFFDETSSFLSLKLVVFIDLEMTIRLSSSMNICTYQSDLKFERFN